MKTKIERSGAATPVYEDGDALPANVFLEDCDNGIYWTDQHGVIVGGFWQEMFVDADSIGWPLRQSNVKSITISK